MKQVAIINGEQLTNALHALGVNFIMGGNSTGIFLHQQPQTLIAALAESNEARLRLSLIPLFLEHPEFAKDLNRTVNNLSSSAKLILQCYYTAAIWIAKKNNIQTNLLTDYFSQELGLSTTPDIEQNLKLLAQRHKELSHSQVNWLGTYLHAEQVWKKGREYRKA